MKRELSLLTTVVDFSSRKTCCFQICMGHRGIKPSRCSFQAMPFNHTQNHAEKHESKKTKSTGIFDQVATRGHCYLHVKTCRCGDAAAFPIDYRKTRFARMDQSILSSI